MRKPSIFSFQPVSASFRMAACDDVTAVDKDRETLKKESLRIMFDYYRNWWEDGDSSMVCIPPCRDIYVTNKRGKGPFQGPTDELASDYDAEEIAKRRAEIVGNEGESEVLAALQKCCLKQCVLINGFHKAQFIKSIRQKHPDLGTALINHSSKD